jgi:hydroxymethylpyrimidine/phosphomethylpyrimidine kinase
MPAPTVRAPVALTIAGSDCSAGAGLQADLKTFTALGVYGLTAVTCVVAEVPGKVSRIQPVDPKNLGEQVRLLFAAFPVAALKTGMLYSRDVIELVAGTLAALPKLPPLVVDPVMVATSGDALIRGDAVTAYVERLFPMAALITPNLDEAAALLSRRVSRAAALHPAANDLWLEFGRPVLLKGGHLRGSEAVDVLRDADGFAEFRAPVVRGVHTHGTGCTLSAAITAGLASGQPLRQSVRSAKRFVSRAIARSFRWGAGRNRIDALNHFRHARN